MTCGASRFLGVPTLATPFEQQVSGLGLLSSEDFDTLANLDNYTFRGPNVSYQLILGLDGTRRLEDSGSPGTVGHSFVPCYRHASIGLAEMCVQCEEVRSTNLFEELPGIVCKARYGLGGAGSANMQYYFLQLRNDRARLSRVVNVSANTLDEVLADMTNVAGGGNLSIVNSAEACVHSLKLHCAPGLQRGWVDFNAALEVSAADANINTPGQPGVAAEAGGATPVSGWRNLIVMRGNAVTVNGLNDGDILQLDNDPVLQAVAVAGTASVDIVHRQWPRTSLQVLRPNNPINFTPAAGLWGGDVFIA